MTDGARTRTWYTIKICRYNSTMGMVTRVNIIDTPGHVDFVANRSTTFTCVLDGAVTVLDSQSGCRTQTETVWRHNWSMVFTYRICQQNG